MSLFRKKAPKRASDPAAAIAAFWQWWASSAADIAAAFPAGRLPEYAGDVRRRVHAIDPGLAWEFGPGVNSQYQLTVTAEGDAGLRRVARRWLRAAPPADAVWSFHDMRQPSGLDAYLDIGDAKLALKDVRVAVTRRGFGLDVAVHHRLFARLPEQAQRQIAFLCLDAALGEEAVELWVDEITIATREPRDSRPLGDLRGLLEQVIAEAMPDGEMGWSLAHGDGPRGSLLVTCLNRLSSVQAPDWDQHVVVTVPFLDVIEAGWAGEGSFNALRAFEEHLSGIVRGSGHLVATETSGGVQTLHYYVDSTTPAAGQLEAATAGWDQGLVTVTTQLDPSWDGVRAYRNLSQS